MFATLSDLIEYLFGVNIPLPIQTLGCFVALAFVLSFHVFVSEFKRKEKLQLIKPFTKKVITGKAISWIEVVANAAIGFVLGYKIVYIILNYKAFTTAPAQMLFSLNGNLPAALLIAACFAVWVYFDAKKQQLPTPVIVEVVVHPYQLMGKIVFWVAVWGIIGAKLFDCVENIGEFMDDPLNVLLSPRGFAYYGGLIFGALSYLYIGRNAGMKLSHLADIGSPGMMLAYGIGRIGCHLSGDGDWGVANLNDKPLWLKWLPDWAWSFTFPHNVINEGRYIKGCTETHCYQLMQGVYPTSLYEAVACIALFGLMWLIRNKIHIAGMMFCIYLILNGTERFLIEEIRVNNKYNLIGVNVTQAQLICIMMLIGGIGGLVYLFSNMNYRKFESK